MYYSGKIKEHLKKYQQEEQTNKKIKILMMLVQCEWKTNAENFNQDDDGTIYG